MMIDEILEIPLPRYLQEHKEEILHIFDNASGWDYNARAWQERFADDPIVSNDLNKIIGKCPNKICREDVRYFTHEARSGDYEELKRLFLACMVWGWGDSRRGRRLTKAALSDPRLGEVLEKSAERIRNAQIKAAYEGFELHGCKSAFFTKFFYFVGQEQEWKIKPMPLILDSHVANFLEFLSKDKQRGFELSKFVKVGGRKEGRISSLVNYSEGYIQYVCSMEDWGKELGCPADNIEYFMFKEGKKLREQITGETGKRNTMEVEKVNKERKGGEMDKNNKDSILGVRLPPQKMEQLATIAREEYDEQPENLAKFWIIERLHQLGVSLKSYSAPLLSDIGSQKPTADICKGEETKSKLRREMVRATASRVEFRGRHFFKEELCKAIEDKYGPINRSSFILADYCVNKESGPKITDSDGNIVKRYPYLFSPGRGIYERYDQRRHGKWVLVNKVPTQVSQPLST